MFRKTSAISKASRYERSTKSAPQCGGLSELAQHLSWFGAAKRRNLGFSRYENCIPEDFLLSVNGVTVNLAPLFGLLIFAVVLFFMLDGNSTPIIFGKEGVKSLTFVFVGSLAVILVRDSLKDWARMLASFRKLIFHRQVDQTQLVEEMLHLAEVSRKEGPLALEREEVGLSFLKRGLRMAVDGKSPAAIQVEMTKQLAVETKRENKVVEMLEFWADLAPSFGMLGTLVGLIGMMTSMGDPTSMGPAFAIAMLTTMFGVVVGYILVKPLAHRIKGYNRATQEAKSLALEGVLGIAAGTNPRILEDTLVNLMTSKNK
jgi:chemotaxis protein MotA